LRWLQRNVVLTAKPRGAHLIGAELVRAVPELSTFKVGTAHIFLRHTSAALTINENADPDVRSDLTAALDRLVPEGAGYRHDAEGPDDMPAHVKTALLGPSLSVPITDGRLALGTWQGIWLCEFRDAGGPRQVTVTLSGE
jgi:secondary thiamine-phosphate synthase enzyme